MEVPTFVVLNRRAGVGVPMVEEITGGRVETMAGKEATPWRVA